MSKTRTGRSQRSNGQSYKSKPTSLLDYAYKSLPGSDDDLFLYAYEVIFKHQDFNELLATYYLITNVIKGGKKFKSRIGLCCSDSYYTRHINKFSYCFKAEALVLGAHTFLFNNKDYETHAGHYTPHKVVEDNLVYASVRKAYPSDKHYGHRGYKWYPWPSLHKPIAVKPYEFVT